jgi:hypothetical protein
MKFTGTIDRKILKEIDSIVQKHEIHPILIDIGSSGEPPEIWNDIKHYSQYIGFDPDSRDTTNGASLGYWKADIIDKAVIVGDDAFADIFLTKSPHCSSTLLPDIEMLKHYAWHDLFTVLEKTKASAISIPALINQLPLDRIDWFKTDSQGIDLRLFLSIPTLVRDQVLAVDIEPGLMPAYEGEDYFTSAHESLIKQGFWLADMYIGSCPRIHQNSANKIFNTKKLNIGELCRESLIGSPYYCEARYFRTIEWLNSHNADKRDYLLLCIFALIGGKLGYALDVIDAYKRKAIDPNIDGLENILLQTIRKKIWFQEKVPRFINVYLYYLKKLLQI